MKDSGFKLNKEKVFGTIISFAIFYPYNLPL